MAVQDNTGRDPRRHRLLDSRIKVGEKKEVRMGTKRAADENISPFGKSDPC